MKAAIGIVFGAVFVFGLVALIYYVFGVLAAMLFAQFGIIKPWWVFAIGWLMLTSVASLFRGGSK